MPCTESSSRLPNAGSFASYIRERWEAAMERGHEFTVALPGEGTFSSNCSRACTSSGGGGTTGPWPAFDLGRRPTRGRGLPGAAGRPAQRIGDPGSTEFQPFAAYVREHGTRLSDEEAAARELERLREITIRWRVTDDEQYTVRLFQDIAVQRDGDTVTVRAFGLEGSGQQVSEAAQALIGAVKEASGEHDAPGPRFDEFTSWARSNGEPVPADVLAQEAKDKQAYLVRATS